MSASIFYSENGELSAPEEPRRDGTKYAPILPGEPLCVEICRVSLGNSDDWMGENEILASSWAKTGGDARPAPRVLNFYREKLKPYESISNLGAEQFGHNLIFYSPAYSGETLRLTLEVLEVDQGGDEVVTFTKAVCNSLTGLPFFANQLPVLGALSLAPKIAEIGIGLYNLINKNDVLLKADLDLSYQRPFQTPLNPGRYVFVYDKVAPATFIKQYRLSPANLLVESDGRDAARKGGIEVPYAVIQITAEPRKEYVRFQPTSQQQEYLGSIMSRLEDKHLQQIAGVLNPIAELAREGHLLSNILHLQKDLDDVEEPALRTKISKLLNGELAKLADSDMQAVLRRSLKARPSTSRQVKAPKAGKTQAPKAGKGAQESQPPVLVEALKASGKAVTKMALVEAVVRTLSGPFTVAELQAQCPKVTLGWVRHVLFLLRKQGAIKCLGRGRNAQWTVLAQTARK